MSTWNRFFRPIFSSSKFLCKTPLRTVKIAATITTAGVICECISYAHRSHISLFHKLFARRVLCETDDELQVQADHKLSRMELHFLKFASAEYDDAVYMTPADFLDSLTIKAPKERVYRRVLSEDEVKRMLESTPKFGKGGRRMMRTLDRKGLISFADYIFLLTVLMKSEESFKIAFIVFDRDGNGLIEKDEFLMMRSVVSAFRSTRTHATDDRHCAIGKTSELQNLVKRFRLNLREQEKIVFDKSDEEVKMQDTTILIHLFGRNGEKRLSYNDFCMFCHNITSEVTEVEFHLYSRGTNEISPTDFARLLLRYSSLDPEDFARYIHRIHERTLSDDMGINLEQYRNFSKLLYNIDKFAAAVRLYTHANMNVTEKEFIRAVKVSTDVDIDPHVVKLIFKIFDVDENGSLSYSEFIALMMDHVNRGLKPYKKVVAKYGWEAFKQCLANEYSNL